MGAHGHIHVAVTAPSRNRSAVHPINGAWRNSTRRMPDARLIRTGLRQKESSETPRRALLVFADQLGLDCIRRGLPRSVHSLLRAPEKLNATAGGADVHLFTSKVSSAPGAGIHAQEGRTFAERLENAVECLARRGYEQIVIVGRDCPSLTSNDLELAFAQLRENRLVLGPDHRGGCYLIGIQANDRRLLRGIRWKRNRDCAQLRARCDESDVHLLTVKQDVDSWADVALLARSGDAFARLAAFVIGLTRAMLREFTAFVDLAAQAVRVRGQIPPPLSAL